MSVLAFDIETIPDVEAGRRLYGLGDLDDAAVVHAMEHLRFQKTGSQFLGLHLHRIVAISIVYADGDTLSVKSLGNADAHESELLKRFFDGLERSTPTIVSWNGGGFDLPVIHYRALKHGISAPRYWELGDDDREFRYNNYLSRFHWRHIDLMDVLAGFQPRASAPLDEVASLLGLPGKMGMSGAKVWDAYQDGKIAAIRDYCETDALNTYLVFLRFELMRGKLNEKSYADQCARVKTVLSASDKAHLKQFLDVWNSGAST